MWPSDLTIYFLTLGALPPLYIVMDALYRGWHTQLNLGTLGVAMIWVGYHLDPLRGYLSGAALSSFLLRPAYINDGLLFSALSMICLLVGHRIALNFSAKKHNILSTPRIPATKPSWIWGTAVIVLLLFIVSEGGLSEVWRSTSLRGVGQFEPLDMKGKILRIFTIANTALSLLLAVMSAVILLQPTRHIPTGVLGLLVASLNSMHNFSRGAGFALVLCALLSFFYRPNRIIFPLALLVGALLMGSVGLYGRSHYNPGLANYVEAASDLVMYQDNLNFGREYPVDLADSNDNSHWFNPLNAIDPWTLKASVKPEEPPGASYAYNFLYNLNPLPSAFISLRYTGPGLSRVAGTYGTTGITTPTLAEIYYVFGFIGSVLLVPVGWLYGFFDQKMRTAENSAVRLAAVLCAGLIVGMRIAVLFHRFGPYHWARLQAAGERAEVYGIELSGETREYAWAQVDGPASFERVPCIRTEIFAICHQRKCERAFIGS